MNHGSNVVQFPEPTHGLSHSERETLETILYFYTRREISYRDCEYTSQAMRQIRSEQDTKEMRSAAFVFPVSRWPVTNQMDRAVGQLIVVDVGHRRAFYYHADAAPVAASLSSPSR